MKSQFLKVRYPEDCLRIRECLNKLGYDVVSLKQAEALWQEISDDAYASWLDADNDEFVTTRLKEYFGEPE